MQFLKSLFCLQGIDNRTRFVAICSASYVIFIMLISAFSDKAFISLVILAIFTPIIAFTSLRRLKDAKLNKNWLFIPNIIFVLTGLIIIFSEQSSYYLLIISAFCLAILLTYPSVNQKNSAPHNYVLGYFGPVDMTEYQQTSHQSKQSKFRIEPTLVGDNAENQNNDEQTVFQSNATTSSYSENEPKVDLGEIIRLNLVSNRKAQLAIVIILTITLLSMCVSWLMEYFSNNEQSLKTQELNTLTEITKKALERKHPLAMPDNFSLYLSQHQGITINWQADEVSTPLLWSQSSAQGDNSCQQISFNKGKAIRTIAVEVESDGLDGSGIYNNYFASFSPLDSKTLIQSLAFRGSFSLCGYDFSLKGSQAALGQNKQYANWVEY